jgi:hypothetical protein
MNEKLYEVRAARIDALANEIIADAIADEAERRRHNAEEMKRLERRLASGSKSERGTTWKP